MNDVMVYVGLKDRSGLWSISIHIPAKIQHDVRLAYPQLARAEYLWHKQRRSFKTI